MKALAARVALFVPLGAAIGVGGPVRGQPAGPPLLAPAGTPLLTIIPSNPAPVLGIDGEIDLAIAMPGTGPDVTFRIASNVGRVESPIGTSAGAWTARFVLPERRFPQTAIVSVFASSADRTASGVIFVPLRAVASPAFKTDPGAEVTLRIGDKDFGPMRAGPHGEVHVPVVVPPGVGSGLARSSNRAGKVTEQTIDLRLPDYARVLIAAPRALAIASNAEVAVFAVDRAGNPVPRGATSLLAGGRRAAVLDAGPGGSRFLVVAPTAPSATPWPLAARVAGTDGETRAALEIVTGPPANLRVVSPAGRLAIGTTDVIDVVLRPEDGWGNPATLGPARVFVDGIAMDSRVEDDGTLVVSIPAPVAYRGRDRVVVEAAAGTLYSRTEIPLDNVPVVRAEPPSPPSPNVAVTPRAGLLLSPHRNPGAAFLVEAFFRPTRIAWWSPAWLATFETGYLRSDVWTADALGLTRAGLDQIPILVGVRRRFRPARNLELAVGGAVGIAILRSRFEIFDRTLAATTIGPAFKVGAELAIPMGGGQAVASLHYLASFTDRLTSGDRLDGNPGGFVGDVGWRVGL